MKVVVGALCVIVFTAGAVFTPLGEVVVRLAEKLPVLLAVLLAAVFVRLARGMPTIPHEKIQPSKAKTATLAFRKLVSAYVQTFAIFIVAIILNLILATLKPEEIAAIPSFLPAGLLGLVDGLVVLSIIFLVASDVSLARIQADLIDEVTNASSAAAAEQSAANVRSSFEGKDRSGPKITQL